MSIATEFQNELKHVQQVLQRLGPGERDMLGYILYSTQSDSHIYVALRWKTFHLQQDLEGQESQEDPVSQKKKKINNAVIILNQNPD